MLNLRLNPTKHFRTLLKLPSLERIKFYLAFFLAFSLLAPVPPGSVGFRRLCCRAVAGRPPRRARLRQRPFPRGLHTRLHVRLHGSNRCGGATSGFLLPPYCFLMSAPGPSGSASGATDPDSTAPSPLLSAVRVLGLSLCLASRPRPLTGISGLGLDVDLDLLFHWSLEL